MIQLLKVASNKDDTFCSQNQRIREEASHNYTEKFLLYKSYTSKMKPQGKMFKKNYPKGSDQKEAYMFAIRRTPMSEEILLCRRPFQACFRGVQKPRVSVSSHPRALVFRMSWVLRLHRQQLTFRPFLQPQFPTPADILTSFSCSSSPGLLSFVSSCGALWHSSPDASK